MVQVSVIIVNYNAAPFLELCLNGVRAASKKISTEIIIVDNASSDESCDMIRQKYPGVKLICNTENTGFSKANNQAVKIARGAYVLFLNPDTLIGENSLLNVLKFAENQKDFGALGVRMIDGSGAFLPESKRNIPTIKSAFLKLFGSGNQYYANHINEFENSEVDILAGAFLLIKKQVFNRVGGFDETYFMYGEDVDLSYTLLQKGYKNFYLGAETILHFKGESGRKDKKYAENFYNAMYIFYNKYFKKGFADRFLLKLAVKALILFASVKNSAIPQIETPGLTFLYYPDTKLPDIIKNRVKKVIPVRFSNTFYVADERIGGVIFDQTALGNNDMLSLLQDEQIKGKIKRIRPKDALFILGSDRSDKQGVVIRF